MGLRIELLCLYSSLYLSIFLSFKAKFVSQCSPELCKLEFIIFFYFHPFFFLSLYDMLTLKICVSFFSGTFKARMLKLCIHMDNELLYCGIENRTHCSYSSLYLSIFLSFNAKFVSQFSPELYMVESSNMVYVCRMSDCIVGLRLRVMALILLFLSIFPSFPILHVNIKSLCQSFLRNC